tara:strand:+ start:157 stop:387 length:231 start_codon:yes stop_codon:yes gene_type:complete
MKQAEDLFTQELPELGNPLTTHHTPSKFRYRFYITTREGATTEWTGLTAKRAKDMYAYTSQSQPSNVTAFGWEESK